MQAGSKDVLRNADVRNLTSKLQLCAMNRACMGIGHHHTMCSNISSARPSVSRFFSLCAGVKARPSDTGSVELATSLDDSKLNKGSLLQTARPLRLALPADAHAQPEVAGAETRSNPASVSSSPRHSPAASEVWPCGKPALL